MILLSLLSKCNKYLRTPDIFEIFLENEVLRLLIKFPFGPAPLVLFPWPVSRLFQNARQLKFSSRISDWHFQFETAENVR